MEKKEIKQADVTTEAEPAEGILEQIARETTSRAAKFYDRMDDPLAAAERMGALLCKSGFFGIRTDAQGFVLAFSAMLEGRDVLDMARRYHVIEEGGRPRLTKRADAIQAEFQAGGGAVLILETTRKAAEVELSHPVHCPTPIRFRVTLEEMEKSGVTRGKNGTKINWKRFTDDMLFARCISKGVRRVMPGIVVGIYTPEEVSDFDEPASGLQPIKNTPAEKKPTPPPAEMTPEKRASRAVAMFAKAGILRETVIDLAEDQPEEWGEAHYARLNEVRERIKGQEKGDIAEIVEQILAERQAELEGLDTPADEDPADE